MGQQNDVSKQRVRNNSDDNGAQSRQGGEGERAQEGSSGAASDAGEDRSRDVNRAPSRKNDNRR